MFFIFLLVGTWGIGVWITPVGEPLLGVYWISYLIISFFLAIFMTAMFAVDLPYYFKNKKSKKLSEKELNELNNESEITEQTIGLFFWTFIILTLVSILIHYVI